MITLTNGVSHKYNTGYHGDCLKFMKSLPDKSVDLIMADPPYFEVKGDFDFIWDSFGDYLKDVELWAIECKRILAGNGSLFWWGHAKKIAYSQIILDKYFKLENSLVWHGIDKQTNKGYKTFRSFMPVTERCLFYSNEVNRTGLQEIKCNANLFQSLKKYLRTEKIKSGLTLTDLNEILVNKRQSDCIAKRYFGDSLWELPTKEMYIKLQTTGYFRKPYEELRAEYEELRAEYEELRRPFNNIDRLTDVIPHSQESHISRKYDHDTIKPLGLIMKLLKTTTSKDSLVYIPFLGSWTSAVACFQLNLSWIGSELNDKHFKDGAERYEKETQQFQLF